MSNDYQDNTVLEVLQTLASIPFSKIFRQLQGSQHHRRVALQQAVNIACSTVSVGVYLLLSKSEHE